MQEIGVVARRIWHRRSAERLLGPAVGIVIAAIILLIYAGLVANGNARLHAVMQAQSLAVRGAIETNLNGFGRALRRMANRWEASGGTARRAWEADASDYLRDQPGLREIDWVGASGTIWTVPTRNGPTSNGPTPNDSGKRGYADPDQRAPKVAQALSATGIGTVAPIQTSDGSRGFAMVVPVRIDGREVGYIQAVFDTAAELGGIINGPRYADFSIRISDEGGAIFESKQPPDTNIFALTESFAPAGEEWRISLRPTAVFVASTQSRLPLVFVIGGLIIALLVAVTIDSAFVAWHRGKTIAERGRLIDENDERLRLLLDGISDYAIFMLDETGHVTSWNTGAARIKGYKAEEILGQHISVFYDQEDRRNGVPAAVLETARTTGHYVAEGWRLRKDGSALWASVVITALRDPGGKIIGFVKITRDMSERLTAENNLRESEERFRSVAETAGDAIVSTDADGTIIYANPAAAHIFACAASALSGQAIATLFKATAPPGGVSPAGAIAARAGGDGQAEITGLRLDGREFPMEIAVTKWTADGREFATAIMRDISTRKAEQKRLKEALGEKETLLKEVYHRVKNNLQMVQSLLRINGRTLPAGVARTAMEEAGGRVRAMALVHEKLYQTKNLSHIVLSDYVGDLLKQIEASVGFDGRKISVRMQIAKIEANLDIAIPLGLLINELVSNSVKHGFPQQGGEVLVDIERLASGARLTIGDNGVGLPEDLDLDRPASMGLSLATTLARQLRGRLRIESRKPTRFVMDLAIPNGADTNDRALPKAAA